jgi:uncharacterized protein (TIGR02996 family)
MVTLDGLLEGIVADPEDEGRWLVLADWIEEHDDPGRAELLRLHRRLLATCCEPDDHPERAIWQARIVELLAMGVKPCVPQRSILLADDVEMIFSFIPPGIFLMGSPESEEARGYDEVRHRVTLTRGFWLSVSQVTQSQWKTMRPDYPSKYPGNDLPVDHISWNDCVAFCNLLGENFHLPTEAEWEWACRAGTTTPFFFGETISTDQANYSGKSAYGQGETGGYRGMTTPAGSFPPNAFGLFDMHGNLWDWCEDWCGRYSDKDQQDPVCIINSTYGGRILRGGSCHGSPKMCRSANRSNTSPNIGCFSGCRVLMCLD